MQVAQVNFLPAPPGCEPADLLERWPSLGDIADAVATSGTRVSVIQAGPRRAHLARNGVDYHFSPIDEPRGGAHRLARLLGELQPDVLHVHGLGFARETFALSQCLPRLPIVLQDHADRPPRWWRRAPWRRWYGVASGVAFTAPGLALPFTAARMFPPRARVFAIPESSSRFTPGNRAAARAATGLQGNPCVLWVGHLNEGKDPLTVLEGIARAVSRLPALQLWCAFGSAPLLAEVRARIDGDPRLAGRVHLLGKVAHDHVETLIRSSDLFVSGSRSEGCGYSVLEAIACGVVPVVTDIPALRALTADGEFGSLWPCGDAAALAEALVRAAASRPTPEQMRGHFEATLSFAAVGRRWADAYAQVLDDRRRERA